MKTIILTIAIAASITGAAYLSFNKPQPGVSKYLQADSLVTTKAATAAWQFLQSPKVKQVSENIDSLVSITDKKDTLYVVLISNQTQYGNLAVKGKGNPSFANEFFQHKPVYYEKNILLINTFEKPSAYQTLLLLTGAHLHLNDTGDKYFNAMSAVKFQGEVLRNLGDFNTVFNEAFLVLHQRFDQTKSIDVFKKYDDMVKTEISIRLKLSEKAQVEYFAKNFWLYTAFSVFDTQKDFEPTTAKIEYLKLMEDV